MLSLKQGIKLSAVIDKLDLNIDFNKLLDKNGEVPGEAFGGELVMQLISKAYKAEHEIYAFVAEYKGCSVEEAENIDLTELAQGLMGDKNVATFFRSAVKSKLQG